MPKVILWWAGNKWVSLELSVKERHGALSGQEDHRLLTADTNQELAQIASDLEERINELTLLREQEIISFTLEEELKSSTIKLQTIGVHLEGYLSYEESAEFIETIYKHKFNIRPKVSDPNEIQELEWLLFTQADMSIQQIERFIQLYKKHNPLLN